MSSLMVENGNAYGKFVIGWPANTITVKEKITKINTIIIIKKL